MVLDPATYWCIRSFELDVKTAVGHGKHTLQTQLSEAPNGSMSIPKLCDYKFEYALNQGGNFHIEGVVKFNLRIPSQLPPDEEFTLSAFGLPEPFGMESRSTPWYVWAGGVAIACLVLGGVVAWLRKRLARD